MAETLFGNTQPVVTNASDGAPGLTLATRIRIAADGNIVGLRWRFPDTLPASPVQWFVVSYDPGTDLPTGSLASGTFSSPTAGQYNTASFSPVACNAGDEVCAEIWTSDRYVATNSFFTSGDVVSGNLTGPQDDAVAPVHRNGRFRSGASPAFPSSGTGASYFVDIVVSFISEYPVGVGGSATPSGSLARAVDKPLAGSSTPSAAVAKSLGRALAASTTMVGALIRQVDKPAGGAIAVAGAITKETGKSLAGSATAAAAIVRGLQRSLAGTISPAGAVLKLLSRLVGGTVTPQGAMSTVQGRPALWSAGPPKRRWRARPPEGGS